MEDNKLDYVQIRRKYNRMETPKLEKAIESLFRKRYESYDLSVHEEHRIASAVLTRRNRSGTGMTFHMQNLVVR